MKARVVGTNDVFADVEKVMINGVTYMPEVLEFEVDDNYDYVYTSSNVVDWNKIRIQAAIAAMQGLISHQKGYIEAIRFSKEIDVDTGNILACTAVEHADALIKKLKGK